MIRGGHLSNVRGGIYHIMKKTLSEAWSALPRDWFDERGNPVNRESDFYKVIEDLEVFLKTKSGRGIRGDLRSMLERFVYRNGHVPAGNTNVNPMGTYVVGTPAADRSKVAKLAQRELGERMYVDSVVSGVNKVLKDVGFVKAEDNNYDDLKVAQLAHELDSLSSKGPYDNGQEDTAIRTVNTVLANSVDVTPDDPDYDEALGRWADYLVAEYKGNVDTHSPVKFDTWVATMQSAGLASTMRGLPFHAKGNAKLQERHYDFMAWMLEPVVPADYKYKRGSFKEIQQNKWTVDEFIQATMVELFNVLKLQPLQIMNARLLLMTVISRNQGSPWIISYENGAFVTTDDRKDMKFRAVVPAPALPQAILLLASRPMVKAAPTLRHRIGLESPSVNDTRMMQFIRTAASNKSVLVSTDFSNYDTKLRSQYMATGMAVYAVAHDDPIVKSALLMGAISVTHKIAIFPTYTTDEGTAYSKHPNVTMHSVKGDRRVNVRKIMRQTSNSKLKDQLSEDMKKFDFIARAFYIYKSFLISGIIVTNTLGSDCTDLIEGFLTAEWLWKNGHITKEEREIMTHMISSGDDAVSSIPQRLYDEVGYEGVLALISKANAHFNMEVNPKKQLQVKLKGYPIVDFLQKVYPQINDIDADFYPYVKFIRQLMALPYNERMSKLDPVFQWVSTIGKLESGLCEENKEFAAKVLWEYGQNIYKIAREKGYKPPVPPHMYGDRKGLKWNKAYAVNNSTLGGLEQLVGLVKKYQQRTLSSLGKYLALESVGDAVDNIEAELETRAPHRAQIAASIFASLGHDIYTASGGVERFGVDGADKHWIFVDVLNLLDEYSGGIVQEVLLEKQDKLASIPVDGDASAEEDHDIPEDTLSVE